MASQYQSKAPSPTHFIGANVSDSPSEKSSLPHPKSIRVGSALVPFNEAKGAWAAPYNRYAHPSTQWIYAKSAAQALAQKISAMLVKG